MSEDDRAVMARLAALEAEVKGDADAQRARKEAAMAKIREQRAAQLAEREALRPKPKELAAGKKAPAKPADDEDSGGELDGLSSALDLAKRAQGVKQELSKPGEKSWAKSAIASALLGPIGWLYAGSFREAIPASAAWLAFAALASKLPTFLLMPVFFVALPLSAIAGIMYAVRYNRTGSRQRLFQDKKQLAEKAAKKQLKSGRDD